MTKGRTVNSISVELGACLIQSRKRLNEYTDKKNVIHFSFSPNLQNVPTFICLFNKSVLCTKTNIRSTNNRR